MTLTRSKIGEGHFVGAAHFGFKMMDLGRESIGRQPLHFCVSIEECAVNPLWLGPQYSMQFYGIGWHIGLFVFDCRYYDESIRQFRTN